MLRSPQPSFLQLSTLQPADGATVEVPPKPYRNFAREAHSAHRSGSQAARAIAERGDVYQPVQAEPPGAAGSSSRLMAQRAVAGSRHFYAQDVWAPTSLGDAAPHHGPSQRSEYGLRQHIGHFTSTGSLEVVRSDVTPRSTSPTSPRRGAVQPEEHPEPDAKSPRRGVRAVQPGSPGREEGSPTGRRHGRPATSPESPRAPIRGGAGSQATFGGSAARALICGGS